MPMKRCEKGHYYDAHKHTICPSCGVPDLDIGVTRAVGSPRAGHDAAMHQPAGGGQQARQEAVWRTPRESDETVLAGFSGGGAEPVVGWLVCWEGGERGKDFRLHSEKNYIGRSEKMDVCLKNDPSVSRDNHAIVSYNPRNGVFKVHPGESRGMVYLNGNDVDTPQELKGYDMIELGGTRLIFVPFCSPRFRWTAGPCDHAGPGDDDKTVVMR